MPLKAELALKRKAEKKGFKGKQKARYVFGALRKMGWKPNREKK